MNNEPKEIKLNWTVKEYIGTEVWKVGAENIPITSKDDLKIGDKIHCWPCIMTVRQIEGGTDLVAENDKYMAILEFGGDDRRCWVCGGVINKRCIAKSDNT